MRIAQLLLGGLATVGSVGAASLNATDADAPIKQIGYEADLCGAAVAPTEDGTGDLVLVAVGVSGQPFARRVGSDGRVQSGWVAAPPAASAGRAGPTLVAMPRGGGILCVLCDEGSLFTSIIHTDGRGLELERAPVAVGDGVLPARLLVLPLADQLSRTAALVQP